MSETQIDLDHLRQWVGRERVQTDSLNSFPAQALAAALDRKGVLESNAPLPAAWQWLYFLDKPSASATGSDGHPKLGKFLPPIPLPRRMWAAGNFEILAPLILNTATIRRSVIRSIEAKHGKSGDLIFVTLDHEFLQSGKLCLREEQNLVYREMATAAAPLPPGQTAPANHDWRKEITPDPVLLFRYSALTYNGHRIHYDRHYAIEKEFYPALLVQAPLLATLLLELAAEHLPVGHTVRSFNFRAVRPTFDTHSFSVHAKLENDQMQLWSSDHEGALCVTATAELS